MAPDSRNRFPYHVRDLPTRSVTFYPTNAQVIRDLKNVKLKPGTNEVVISGITPTAIEDSIKVDAVGPASITDLSVQLVTNPEEFDEVYPDSDSEDDLDDSDSSDEDAGSKKGVEHIEVGIKRLKRDVDVQQAAVRASNDELELLNHLYKQLSEYRIDDIPNGTSNYRKRREDIEERKRSAFNACERLEEELKLLNKKRDRYLRDRTKKKAIDEKNAKKQASEKARQRRKREQARKELKVERAVFWPRKVFRLVVSLESLAYTPSFSRRASMESVATQGAEKPTDAGAITLCISYITNFASWIPRYDLHIDTITSAASIVYRAETRNTTSEEWRDAKIVLSTAQTSLNGLSDAIPKLSPWHIRLLKDGSDGHGALKSEQEGSSRPQGEGFTPWNISRHSLFGIDQPMEILPLAQPATSLFGQPASTGFGTNTAAQSVAKAKVGGVFGSAESSAFPGGAPTGGLFGASPSSNQQSSASLGAQPPAARSSSSLFGSRAASLFGSSSQPPPSPAGMSKKESRSESMPPPPPPPPAPNADSSRRKEAENEAGEAEDDSATLAQPEPAWEESGMTMTYEVPGQRTIPASNTHRRLKIDSFDLSKVDLAHGAVPKLRAAVFLKARITNTSGITLLRGKAGLSVDGSFLGNVDVPRCEAGGNFQLSLGVDPGVKVEYVPPRARRNRERGVLNKSDSVVYEREIVVRNNKAGGQPLDVRVLDQVPVSQDERLAVEVLRPTGLRAEGAGVNTGEVAPSEGGAAMTTTTAAAATRSASVRGQEGHGRNGSVSSSSSRVNEKWGKATAEMQKDGEVEWKVRLNPGCGVKLALQYETRYPAGENVATAASGNARWGSGSGALWGGSNKAWGNK